MKDGWEGQGCVGRMHLLHDHAGNVCLAPRSKKDTAYSLFMTLMIVLYLRSIYSLKAYVWLHIGPH